MSTVSYLDPKLNKLSFFPFLRHLPVSWKRQNVNTQNNAWSCSMKNIFFSLKGVLPAFWMFTKFIQLLHKSFPLIFNPHESKNVLQNEIRIPFRRKKNTTFPYAWKFPSFSPAPIKCQEHCSSDKGNLLTHAPSRCF